MIASCRHCHEYYWRYSRAHPPQGFCSVPCYLAGRTRPDLSQAPPRPEVVLARLRKHLLWEHDTLDLTVWFDCAECDALDELQNTAEAYWAPRPLSMVFPRHYRQKQKESKV